jgi:hypothetical protein
LEFFFQVFAPLQLGEVDLTADTDSEGVIQVKSGASRELFLSTKLRKVRKNALHQTSVEEDLRMRLIVAGRTIEMSLLRAERHFYFIQNAEEVQRPYRLIVDIVAETSYKVIHLQSSMTITSYLLMPMELEGISSFKNFFFQKKISNSSKKNQISKKKFRWLRLCGPHRTGGS